MASDDASNRVDRHREGWGSRIAGMLVATVVAIGVGGAVAVLRPQGPPAPEAKPTHEEAQGSGKHAAVAKYVVDLPPIVTNLTAPRDVWIRVELSMLFNKPVERPEQIAAQFGTDVLAYLRTISAEQIEGPAGLLGLRDELNERAATRSNGAASEVAIRTLVVQ